MQLVSLVFGRESQVGTKGVSGWHRLGEEGVGSILVHAVFPTNIPFQYSLPIPFQGHSCARRRECPPAPWKRRGERREEEERGREEVEVDDREGRCGTDFDSSQSSVETTEAKPTTKK